MNTEKILSEIEKLREKRDKVAKLSILSNSEGGAFLISFLSDWIKSYEKNIFALLTTPGNIGNEAIQLASKRESLIQIKELLESSNSGWLENYDAQINDLESKLKGEQDNG